jgi:hypothetical protein
MCECGKALPLGIVHREGDDINDPVFIARRLAAENRPMLNQVGDWLRVHNGYGHAWNPCAIMPEDKFNGIS